MPNSPLKHKIILTTEQREELERVVRQSSVGVAKKRWAQVMLMSDEAHSDGRKLDTEISETLGISLRQLGRIRKKFVELGFEASLARRPRKDAGESKTFDGQAEAQLVTLCCSAPPEGYDRWTLQLLCDELGRLEIVESVCRETVRQQLQKTNLNLGNRSGSASPLRIDRDLSRRWKRFWISITSPMIPHTR